MSGYACKDGTPDESGGTFVASDNDCGEFGVPSTIDLGEDVKGCICKTPEKYVFDPSCAIHGVRGSRIRAYRYKAEKATKEKK